MYSVYVIESELTGVKYIGYSSNVQTRLKHHNSGKSKFTKSQRPWKLLFVESFSSKSEARKRENQLKKSSWHRSELYMRLDENY